MSWLTSATATEALLSQVAVLAAVRTLEVDDAGRLFFAQALVATTFVLLDPRLEDLIQRYLPILQPLGCERRFFWRIVGADATVGALGLAYLLLFAGSNMAGGFEVIDPTYVSLAAVAAAMSAATGSLNAGLAVAGRLVTVARIRLLTAVPTAALALSGLLAFGGRGYLVGHAVGASVTVGVTLLTARRALPRQPVQRPRVPAELRRPMWNFTLKSWLATSVTIGADSAMLSVAGAVGGPQFVVALKVAMAPGRLLLTAASPIASVAFPRLAKSAATRDRAAIQHLCQRLSARLAAPLLAIVLLAGILLPLALGAVYGRAYSQLWLAALGFVIGFAARALVAWSKVLPLAVGRAGLSLLASSVLSAVSLAAVGVGSALVAEPFKAAEIVGATVAVAGAVWAASWLRLAAWQKLLKPAPPVLTAPQQP